MSIRVDAGILAGGLATRMAGLDKGLQLYQGQPMAQWICDALRPYVATVYINCNRNHLLYQEISPNVCSDTLPDFQGPLAGLVSLMSASQADYLLVSPCDTPLLPQIFAPRMLHALDEKLKQEPTQPWLLAAKDAHRNHPLHLCIATSFKNDIEQALLHGEHRVMHWLSSKQVAWVDFSDYPDSFSNFNSRDDLGRTR